MRTQSHSYLAWAIDANSPEGHGFIGKYWWFNGVHERIPTCVEGYKHAVFLTRRDARDALPSVRRVFPKAKVVRVSVSIAVQRRSYD